MTWWVIGTYGLAILGRKQILEPETGPEVRGVGLKEPLSERIR